MGRQFLRNAIPRFVGWCVVGWIVQMRALYDSTDFANDAMEDLAANFKQLEFPSVNSLIAFLANVAEKKVIDEYRRQHTLKRDVTRERPMFATGPDGGAVQLPSDSPTASQFAQANEVYDRLLDAQDETERTIIDVETRRILEFRYCRANRLEYSQSTAVFRRPP